jgi:hypothetical protein
MIFFSFLVMETTKKSVKKIPQAKTLLEEITVS